jgi:aminoglycoside/choline kinase family phosphotransferase
MQSLLDALTQIDVRAEQQARLGLSSRRLTLRRAWPRSHDHLLLEYGAENGQIVPGQWFADVDRCLAVAQTTLQRAITAAERADHDKTRSAPRCAMLPNAKDTGYLLLQVGGADRVLHGLAPLLARDDAHLLVHQPERRAVVRLGSGDGTRFAKIVPTKRVDGIVAAGRCAAEIAENAFSTPQPLAIDRAAGVVVWSALRGTALHDLLGDERMINGARAAGAALKRLHAAQPTIAHQHNAADEALTLQRWIEKAVYFDPKLEDALASIAPKVVIDLLSDSSPPVLLHRDFYDKQIFVVDDGRIGFLDFDTLAYGEAALDLANALVHFELRALQGRCTKQQAQAAQAAFLDGYQPDQHTCRRIDAYGAAARLRLACVYSFRPAWRAAVGALLAHDALLREPTHVGAI